ncbi:hypothetical protein BBJ28_00002277 [Nothophytophthora sp. Chile5]|nr:hypothetical protein BBJ28_00002277 [Nothophytophthora sp. Chile5]
MRNGMRGDGGAQHALLRARELCLLGDYERGMKEFRSVQKQLEVQLLGAASPTEDRETALQDLTLTASEVQHTQRRNSAMRERKLRQQQEEQAAQAMDTDDAPIKRVRLLYLTTVPSLCGAAA